MTQDAALLVRVNVREDADCFYASSADLPGLHICATSTEDLCASTIKAVKALFKHNHNMAVEVLPVAATPDEFPVMPMACAGDQFVIQRLAA